MCPTSRLQHGPESHSSPLLSTLCTLVSQTGQDRCQHDGQPEQTHVQEEVPSSLFMCGRAHPQARDCAFAVQPSSSVSSETCAPSNAPSDALFLSLHPEPTGQPRARSAAVALEVSRRQTAASPCPDVLDWRAITRSGTLDSDLEDEWSDGGELSDADDADLDGMAESVGLHSTDIVTKAEAVARLNDIERRLQQASYLCARADFLAASRMLTFALPWYNMHAPTEFLFQRLRRAVVSRWLLRARIRLGLRDFSAARNAAEHALVYDADNTAALDILRRLQRLTRDVSYLMRFQQRRASSASPDTAKRRRLSGSVRQTVSVTADAGVAPDDNEEDFESEADDGAI